jgi:dephospho-CoA kinase
MIIGLTGGIGSGKTQASSRFMQHGISVVNADVVAREVVMPNSPALREIAQHFGSNILDDDGVLNRRKLREIIFQSAAEKQWLEALLHPLINAEIRRQLASSTSPYTILESPLLLETKQYELVDRIAVVDVSELIQVERAAMRDNSDDEQIKAIIQAQLNRQERCARAHDIIQNHGNIEELEQQVDKLHRLYLELAQAETKSTQ